MVIMRNGKSDNNIYHLIMLTIGFLTSHGNDRPGLLVANSWELIVGSRYLRVNRALLAMLQEV